MPERGFLVIADITGYTRFLTGSELDHAQGVLQDLFAVILERLKSPLLLSNIQGDAFFAYAGDDAVLAPGQIVDSLEAVYFGFRERLTAIVDNTTCACRACRNAPDLDLKFIVHHGEYVVQDIADRRELTGADVILLHRLMKNDVPEQTGVSSYGLFTAAAVDALDLAELADDTRPYKTDVEEFGRIEGAVIDFGSRWLDYHAANEIVVSDDELWFEPVSRLLPASIETVWEAFCNAGLQAEWNKAVQGYERVKGDPGRLRVGAVDHCAHGNQTLVMRHVDVRPLKHITTESAIPLNGKARWTTEFTPENGGTRISIRVSRPIGPTATARFLLGIIGGLFIKPNIRRQLLAELPMLDAFLAERKNLRTGIGNAASTHSEYHIEQAATRVAGGDKADQ